MEIPEEARKRYDQQKSAATTRNIKWNFTFNEWWEWWEATGHWHERGIQKGQYCMARFNDIGPYELGNIKCILHSENVSESQKANTRNFTDKTHTEESKQKMSNAKKGVRRKHPTNESRDK